MTNEQVNTKSWHCKYYTGYGENFDPLQSWVYNIMYI